MPPVPVTHLLPCPASPIAGNPSLVPGVRLWMDSFIRHYLLQPFLFPEGLTYRCV